MLPELSHIKFLKLQDRFHRAVHKSPVSCILRVTNVTDSPTEKGFTKFTGDSTRGFTDYTFKCLYQREIPQWSRIKQGLNQDISGLVYLSGKDVLETFLGVIPHEHLLTKVFLYDDEFGVESQVQKEPLYNSLIALELRLRCFKRM